MAQKHLHQIDELLRFGKKSYSAEALAQELGISRRQVVTCIEQLRQEYQAPIPRRSRQGYYYTDPTFALKRLLLTEKQLASIRRALEAAQEFGGANEGELVQLLADMVLEGKLPHVHFRVSGAIHPAPGIGLAPALVDELEEARRWRRRVRLVYWSAHKNEVTERFVQPYLLHNHQGELYLIAWCELRNEVRDFLLTRIRHWQVLDEETAYTTTAFDADDYIKNSFGVRHGEPLVTVKVRFSPYQSRWIKERQYHPSQEIEEQENGGVVLTVKVTGTFEIKRWVLGFGPEAEVLEPESLRHELAEDVKKLRGIYERESPQR